jgi:SAM-dependent methyltransferase
MVLLPSCLRGVARESYHLIRHALAEAKFLRRLAWHMLSSGTGRTCPVCGHTCRLFKAVGSARRPDAECPECGSRERHRFLWSYLQRGLAPQPAGAMLLHVAPEQFLEAPLRRLLAGWRCVSGDLSSRAAMVHFDLRQLPISDRAVDLVICSHVLEHIPEDFLAMREIARVLSATGVALIVVPMGNGATREDLSINDPAERAKRCGQEDHVRMYGDDFAVRLERAGLVVDQVLPGDVLANRARRICGVPRWVEPIFVCRRHD